MVPLTLSPPSPSLEKLALAVSLASQRPYTPWKLLRVLALHLAKYTKCLTHTHTIVSRERENHTESNSKKHDEFIQGYWKICIAGVLRAIKPNCKPCTRLKPLQDRGVAIGAGIRSTGGAATPPGLKLFPLYTGFTVWFPSSQLPPHTHFSSTLGCSSTPGTPCSSTYESIKKKSKSSLNSIYFSS